MRNLKILSAATAAGLVLAGCGTSSSAEGGSLAQSITLTSSVQPEVFDPHNSRSQYDLQSLMMLYDSLLVRDQEGALVPGIAEEWSLSDDATEVTLKLAEGRTFHDGSPIDAEAVKANIEHAAAEGATTESDLDGLQRVDVGGEGTVSLTFEKAAGHIPSVLAMEAGLIANPEYLEDPDFAGGIPEAGSGAFTFGANTNNGYTFEKWEDYYAADTVSFNEFRLISQGDDNTRLSAIRSGQADFGNIRMGQIQEAESSGVQVITNTTGSIYNMRVNASEGPLADPDLRRSVMHAIDRESINETFYNGRCTPAVQIFPEGSVAHDPNFDDAAYGYDTDKAESFLDSSDYDGEPIEILTFSVTVYTTLAEAVQSQLKAVGIPAEITTVETAQYRARYGSGDYELTVGPSEVNRPEESVYLENATLPGGAQYAGDFEVPGLREAIEESRTAAEDEERAEAFHEFNQIFQEEGPVMIPICHPQIVTAAVEGLEGAEVPPYYNSTYKNLSLRE